MGYPLVTESLEEEVSQENVAYEPSRVVVPWCQTVEGWGVYVGVQSRGLPKLRSSWLKEQVNGEGKEASDTGVGWGKHRWNGEGSMEAKKTLPYVKQRAV